MTELARGGNLERKGLYGLRNGKWDCDDAPAKALGLPWVGNETKMVSWLSC